MPKRYTDAKYELVSGPDPRLARRDLPQWFKRLVLTLAALFALGTAVYRATGHEFTGSQAEASATAGPQAQAAR